MDINVNDLKRKEAKNIIDDVLQEHFEDGVDEKISEENSEIRSANSYLKIYEQIKRKTSGNITTLGDGTATSLLECKNEMVVDSKGLIHNGFIFNAASFCASAAINELNIFIVGSKVKFLAPSRENDIVKFEAISKYNEGKKREVIVKAYTNEIKVFEGEFYAVLLNEHPLENKWYDVLEKK